MLVAYASRTGNVKRFINKTGMANVPITQGLKLNEPFVLVTYTTDFGKVPEQVLHFLAENSDYLVGVSASGNKNWGVELFARSADTIAQLYNVPIVTKFEMSGTTKEVEAFIREVKSIEAHRT